MTPFYRKSLGLCCLPIIGQLFLGCGGSWIDGNPENQFIAIGDPADNSACMIGPGFAIGTGDGIIVFTAKHPRCRKSGTKFDTPDGWNGKNLVADQCLHTVIKWLAQTSR